MIGKVALVALGGALGALARYGLVSLVYRAAGVSSPWGTALVNVLGCLLFGLFWGLALHRQSFAGYAEIFVLVGFLGAFTTFSTFAFHTAEYLRASQWTLAFADMAVSNVLGIGALFLGLAVGKAL